MTKDDFIDPLVYETALENAISFKCIKLSLPTVWTVPQSRTMYKEQTGPRAKPCIDFIFNERIDTLAVEIALNNNSKGVQEHLARFENKYKKLNKNGFIFHIQKQIIIKFK